MKILLFGKSGQVGWELQRSLAPLGELVALDFDSKELCGDFTRVEDVVHTVRAVSPHVIVNAAAHTAVDKAEGEPDLVRAINALAPAALASVLGISVRKLERHCRRIYGQSPMQLYLKVRLQAARNLLFYEEQTMKDIADACGFSYPSVFTRAPSSSRSRRSRRRGKTRRPRACGCISHGPT